MMMERRDPEYLFSIAQFFRCDLNNDREDFENIDSRDDYENKECIRHHRDDSEIRPECKGPNIAHIELGGFNIEPEKCDQRSNDNHTERREEEKSLMVGNKGVYSVIKEEDSSCESVESVCDIHCIRHRDDDEDENRDIEESEIERSEEWNLKTRVSEFEIEPVCPKSCEDHEKNHFYARREPLGTSDPADIHIIVDESDEPNSRECKEREVGFVSIE